MSTNKNRGLDNDVLLSEFHERVSNDRSESTADRYRTNVRAWLEWCDENGIHPLDARSGELKSHLRSMAEDGYAKDSMKIRRASVSMLYKQCKEIATDRTAKFDLDPDNVGENPSDELDLSNWQPMNEGTKKEQALKETEGKHYLDPDDKEQLCENVPAPELRNELIVRLLYQTGLREDELAETRIEDIDRDERSIKVRADKTYLNRRVYYQPSLDMYLDQWLDAGYRDAVPGANESPYLLLTREKQRMTGHYVNRLVIRSARKAGIQDVMYVDSGGRERVKITAHTLRHSFAVQSIKNGMDIRSLQKIMGHANLDTTEEYLRVIDDDIRDVARKYGAGAGNDESNN